MAYRLPLQVHHGLIRTYGGFDYSFVDEKLEKFYCGICMKVLRDPHQMKCGQVFCESCLDNWFAQRRKESCPHCRAEGKEFMHFFDTRLKREIDSLRIHCTNKEKGCQWIGELGSLKDHLESANGCGYVKVECPNGCNDQLLQGVATRIVKRIERKDLADHLNHKCYLRPYTCKYCGRSGTYRGITGRHSSESVPSTTCHYDKCPEFPRRCPNKCGVIDIKRKDMDHHRSKCPEEPVQCLFEEAGCKAKLVRHELKLHVESNQLKHQLMFMGSYKQMKKENKEMKKAYSHMKDTLAETVDELDKLKRRLDRKRKRNDSDTESDSDSDSDY